jgi:hypothetical protein
MGPCDDIQITKNPNYPDISRLADEGVVLLVCKVLVGDRPC